MVAPALREPEDSARLTVQAPAAEPTAVAPPASRPSALTVFPHATLQTVARDSSPLERYGHLRFPDLDGPDDARLVEISNYATRVADAFGQRLQDALSRLGFSYPVKVASKSALSIYKKLRARHLAGRDYPLSRLTDAARGRINIRSNDLRETARLDQVLRAYFKIPPDCEQSPNYLRRFMETRQNAYARSHIVLHDGQGNPFELQIGTQDFQDFNSTRVGKAKISAVYKENTTGAPVAKSISDEYYALQREINLANLDGRSFKTDPALMARVDALKQEISKHLPHHVSACSQSG